MIAINLNIGEETIKEYLTKLKLKGFLKRIGPDRGGYWEFIDGKKGKDGDDSPY